MSGAPGRRHVLAMVAAGAVALLVAGDDDAAPQTRGTVVIAGGSVGGTYLRLARLLASALVEGRVVLAAPVRITAGSIDNLQMLGGGKADLGFTLADAALRSSSTSMALVRTHQTHLNLLVRADSPVREIADLQGLPVSLGPRSSGDAETGRELLRTVGVDDESTWVYRSLRDSAAALAGGSISAMLWWGGLPPAELQALHQRHRYRLLDLSEAVEPMNQRLGGGYEIVRISPVVYGQGQAIQTLGVGNLLACSPDLPAEVAVAVVDLCADSASSLIPQPADGLQFLEPASLTDTAPLPLHPAAIRRYRERHG